MPVYNYQCTACEDDFTLFRTIAERSDPAFCPDCKAVATRMITAPNLAIMSPIKRKIAVTNERSQHAPRVTSPAGSHRCGSSCGCGPGKGGTGKMVKTKLGEVKTQTKVTRPWMLGH